MGPCPQMFPITAPEGEGNDRRGTEGKKKGVSHPPPPSRQLWIRPCCEQTNKQVHITCVYVYIYSMQ